MKNLIIDGNNLLHRAYWIATNKANSAPDNSFLHVHLFLNSIKLYVKTCKPNKIFCCWDERKEKKENARKKLYTIYKENRNKENLKEVYSKISEIKEALESLGIKNVFPYQYEADDTMFFLSRNLPGESIIVTVDKDLHQAVSDNVSIFDPIKKQFITKNDIDVTKFVLTKAIQGDQSDNIEGIAGFGKKTLEKYFAGVITLNDEQNSILQRNLNIVDLTKGGINCREECSYINQQIQVNSQPDYDKFVNLCKQLNLNTIVSKIEEWNELFFFENAYTSILESLFYGND